MKSMPNLREIRRALTDNEIFDKVQGVEVSLKNKIDEEKGIFEISLFAKKKDTGLSILLETRIAIEQHTEGQGHPLPHIQINNKGIMEELARKGKLHITLLVENGDELTKCCNGFLYAAGEILEDIGKLIGDNIELRKFFFYVSVLDKFKPDKAMLQRFIYNSFKNHQVKFFNEPAALIEYKGKKSEEEIDFSNPFKILKVLLDMGFLNRLTLDPLLKIILEEGRIKSKCNGLTIEECRSVLLKMDKNKLKYFNESQFIKKFNK